MKTWRFREGMSYLSPAPLYHSAPYAGVGFTIRMGGTAVIMEQLRSRAVLDACREVPADAQPVGADDVLPHAQAAREVRHKYDVSSLEVAIHAAAPCPLQVKEKMIEWWGPVLLEYYSATELLGWAVCDSEEWLSHRGTVGKSGLRRYTRARR